MPFDQLKRRDFITLLGGAAVAWPLAAQAQQSNRMRRIGVLMGYAESDAAAQAQVAALRQELRKLGWEEGRNIHIDVRFPGTDAGRARAILMELISLTPDVFRIGRLPSAGINWLQHLHLGLDCGRRQQPRIPPLQFR